jgi:cytochrome c oxidase cbb3-type subunit I/II
MAQANRIRINLKVESNNKLLVNKEKEIVALIAYLQRIGTDIKAEQKAVAAEK